MSIRALHLAVTSRSVVSFLIMLSEEIENNDIKSSPDETSTMPNKRFVSSHKIACCFKGLITRSHSCQIHVFRLTDSRSLCCMTLQVAGETNIQYTAGRLGFQGINRD